MANCVLGPDLTYNLKPCKQEKFVDYIYLLILFAATLVIVSDRGSIKCFARSMEVLLLF